MYDWQNFDFVFQGKPDCSFDEKTVGTIVKNRKELAGTLFFDRVWSTLGLKDGKSVKPRCICLVVVGIVLSLQSFNAVGLTLP